MKGKVYVGRPYGFVDVITPSGDTYPLNHVVLHSPSGFAWGYGGSGPADLALSILCDVFGEQPTDVQIRNGDIKGWKFHQDFKWAFVSRWNKDRPFRISEDDIIEWLRSSGAEV